MRDWYCRLLLRSFPRALRDRVGRPLTQTLIEDSTRPSGRLALGRLAVNSLDVVRAGLAERRGRAARRDETAAARPSLANDLRHARRSLVRRPAFTFTVFTTLALGLGLNTAIFSVVHGVLITELPYRDPSRLAFMWTKLAWVGVPRAWAAGPHIDRVPREASTIETVLPLRATDMQMAGDSTPQMVRAGLTHAPLFDVLGVRALHGRTFVTEDEPRNVAILGHALWQQRFGGDPGVIGRSVDLGGDAMEIIGVLPRDVDFLVHSSLGGPRGVDVWLPTRWPLAEMSDGSFAFAALVRVKPTATLAQAQAELDTIGARLDAERYKSRGFGWQLTGVQDDLVKEARPALLLILGGAGLLLAVVCANVVGLLLVRHADRRREFAVRAALGAGRRDIVRLVVVECLMLSVTAGLAGVGLAAASVRVLRASSALPIPRLAEVTVDWQVAAFAMALAVAAGLAASVIPAWRFTRTNAASALADAARGSSGQTGRPRAVLVAAELALAVVLVAGSALLMRSYVAIRAVDPGFEPTGTLTADVQLLHTRYPESAQAVDFFSRVTESLRAMPGVTAVGATTSAPLQANADQDNVRPAGWTPPSPDVNAIMVDLIRSTPGYFAAMGIPLEAGRDFTWADRAEGAPIAIIDTTFAQQAWPGADPIGRTFTIPGTSAAISVVGVVRHARQYRLDADDRPQLYRPYAQDTVESMTLAVRTDGDPGRLPDLVRRAVWAVDAKQPVADVTTATGVVDRALSGRRIQLESLGGFAIGAAVLAALGLYGLLASLVVERQREIGIRMALGADRGSVRRLIGGYLFRVAGAGLVIGAAVVALASRSLAPFLYGVTPADPAALLSTVAAVLLFVSAAAYLPIRGATSVDPADALRRD